MNNVKRFLQKPYKYLVLHACKYIDGFHRKCSHNCIFCFENVDIEKSNKILPSIKMIEDVFVDIDKHNKKYGIIKLDKVYIAGGEPTMREDIFDIITLVSKMSKQVVLSSHADYERPSVLIPKLKKAGITNISISLHGPDPETHEFVTRTKDSFKNTMSSVEVCIDENITVSLNCVVTALNINKILDIVNMLNKKCPDIDSITFTHYRYSGLACEQVILDFHSLNFSCEIEKVIDFAEKTFFSVNFRDFPLCLNKRLVNYNIDVESYFVIIWDDPDTYMLVSEQSRKIHLPMCKCCTLKDQCKGVLSANFNIYDKYTAWSKLDES